MKVRVIVGFETGAHERHSRQMRRTASAFTDDLSTVEVFQLPDDPTSLVAVFTVPTAAHGDLVSRVEREFWNCVGDVTGPVVTAFSETEPKREIIE